MTGSPSDSLDRQGFASLVNKAVDDVLERTTGSEELIDLGNVIVNVLVSRFDNPGISVDDAIAENWDESVEEVLGWLP